MTDFRERVAYMRRDFDLSTLQRSRYWAEECRMIVEAMLAAAPQPQAAVVLLDGTGHSAGDVVEACRNWQARGIVAPQPQAAKLEGVHAATVTRVDDGDEVAEHRVEFVPGFDAWLDGAPAGTSVKLWLGPTAPRPQASAEYRATAKRNLRMMIEGGSVDKALMLKCLEELS